MTANIKTNGLRTYVCKPDFLCYNICIRLKMPLFEATDGIRQERTRYNDDSL